MADKGILEINDILNDYSQDIQEEITKAAQELAREDVNKLKNTKDTYKVRSGKYNKGWTVKTTKGRGFVTCIVHNKDQYQLTHLLENGHRIVARNGTIKGTTKAFKHIAPVEQYSNKEYEQRVENIIKNGG